VLAVLDRLDDLAKDAEAVGVRALTSSKGGQGHAMAPPAGPGHTAGPGQ
jgi:hypothetical protein